MRPIASKLIALLLALPSIAVAGWPQGGIPLAPIPLSQGQFRPHILTSNGNAFVYWQDGRWFDSWDLYCQFVTRFGQIAPAWPDTGLMIARAHDDQIPEPGFALADGSFLVLFGDYRDLVPGGTGLDPYVTRVRADASIAPGYPPHGFQLMNRAGSQRPAIVGMVAPDTLVFLWAESFAVPDIFAQRVAITPTGPSSVWGVDGVRAIPATRDLRAAVVVPDGAGACFIAFDDYVDYVEPQVGDSDVYLIHIGRDGAPYPGWPPSGRPVAVAPGYQESSWSCEDGAGGVYVAWADARTGAGLPFPDYLSYLDIRLTHLDAEGAPRAGWPADGIIVSSRPGWQDYPQLQPDGSGGVWVLWDDYSGGISLTHVLADGTFAPGWHADGLRVSMLETYQREPKMVSDGAGGMYVCLFDELRTDLYLQHVLGSGVRDPLWPPHGYHVTEFAGGGKEDADIASDGLGGCYVAFMRPVGGTGPLNLHLALYSPGGPVPVKLAEATVDAEPNRVRITWHGVAGVANELTVQRRLDGIESWTSLGRPMANGRDMVEYEDASVEPGSNYAYRLTRGAEILSTESRVTVPAAAVFALAGARPNPARTTEVSVAFTLTGHGQAELEVLDLAGRRVHARSLKGLGAGQHMVSLADGRLTPGVHWLKLREGARAATARMIVVR